MTAPAEWVGVLEELREIAAFLDGSATFEGRWFGDEDVPLVAGKYPARYWWRKALRERVEAVAAALRAQQEPVLYRYWQPTLRRWGYTENATIPGAHPLYAAPPATPEPKR